MTRTSFTTENGKYIVLMLRPGTLECESIINLHSNNMHALSRGKTSTHATVIPDSHQHFHCQDYGD